jgi:CheY-like chemotaxis protein
MNEQLERQVAERTSELQAALDSARQSSEAKSVFLSGMSHELRTPMNAILGFSQLLQLQPLPAQQLDAVNEIRGAGQHLLALIDDLLDLTRIEAGKLAVVAVPVDVAEVVDEALRFAQPMFAARRLELVNRTPAGPRMRADPVRLRQVLVNLLSNAAKYNREGGRVVIDATSQGPQRLRLRVSDTGQGIAPERMHRLFQTFERLGAEHSGIEGSGIGLALSRQLAELMGGTLGVESQVGEGSTFWVELPVATGGVTEQAATGASAQPTVAAAAFEVLYIEDNRANLKVVELMFQARPHWRLVTATTGPQGLERARDGRFDAILLDIHLPGMDGYEVLQALQADARLRAVPVVALSADAMPVQVERGLRAGFRDYLPKPLDLQRLMSLLAELSDLKRS